MSRKIEALLDELATYLPQTSAYNPKVSDASVGWHIGHLALSTRNIVFYLASPKKMPLQKSFNIKRVWVLGVGKIPRGKGKAPVVSMPKQEQIEQPEQLQKNIEKAKVAIQNLAEIPPDSYFPHPIFGHLNKKQSIRFIEIHLLHHLHIIQDILQSPQK